MTLAERDGFLRVMTSHGWLGASPTRTDGAAKVTGAARYVDDLTFEGMLHGRTVRSTVARGRLRGVRFLPGVPWDEIVVVTAKDMAPGTNAVHLIEDDQPYLADTEIRHAAEPVVLLAHADKDVLARAARLVELDVEPLPAILSVDDAERSPAQYGTDNVFKRFHVRRGDAAAAMARADVIVEGTYETGAQEQLYIEPQGMIAQWSDTDGITVWGSLQCPYYVHKALVPLFGLPPQKVRVVQAVTGGGFGGKEEYPNMIAGHAALLAKKAARPVKLVYDRLEDMWATTKRHPSRTHVKSGFTKDGKLVALELDVLMDGGAYLTLSPVVLSRGTLHAAGAYQCDDVSIKSRAVLTNCPPYGAFRGFGAPQTLFAIETHMERAAIALGIDAIELRRKNFVHGGDVLPTGQVLQEDPGLDAILDTALRESDFAKRRAAHEAHNAKTRATGRGTLRGIGLSAFLHGSGLTGSGEVKLQSRAAIELATDGRVRVLAASTDIGQGTTTIFAQIVAQRLGLPLDAIEVVAPDTAQVPDSGPTVASRTVMVVGGLIDRCSADARAALVATGTGVTAAGATSRDAFAAAVRAHAAKGGALRFERQYERPPGVVWDDDTYTGDAYATYAWSVHVADVEVERDSGRAEITDFVAVQDVGTVLHPTLAAGQIEGGVAQGIGWALYEDVVLKDGAMANHQLTNYIVPTAADAPPIRVFFDERPYAYGPGGAKGLGELPMDGPAPAIAAALGQAIGTVPTQLPFIPERVLDALDAVAERATA